MLLVRSPLRRTPRELRRARLGVRHQKSHPVNRGLDAPREGRSPADTIKPMLFVGLISGVVVINAFYFLAPSPTATSSTARQLHDRNTSKTFLT